MFKITILHYDALSRVGLLILCFNFHSTSFFQESDTPLTLSIKKNHSEDEILKIAKILLDQGAKKDIKDMVRLLLKHFPSE